MWRMMQLERPEDIVIATGETHALSEFVECAFRANELDWHRHVDSNPSLFRPTDVLVSRANPAKAAALLDWRAHTKMPELARRMVAAEHRRLDASH
jgi:GDPmannose 4,6-dehydratase